MKTYYRIETGMQNDPTIEVYGDGENGWYEWRLTWPDNRVPVETDDAGYGSPEVALRDALCFVYGRPMEGLSLKPQSSYDRGRPYNDWAGYRTAEWALETIRYERGLEADSNRLKRNIDPAELDQAILRAQRGSDLEP